VIAVVVVVVVFDCSKRMEMMKWGLDVRRVGDVCMIGGRSFFHREFSVASLSSLLTTLVMWAVETFPWYDFVTILDEYTYAGGFC